MNKLIVYSTVGLIGLIVLNPVYFVQSGTKAVIKRFGIVKQEVINEGMHVKTPFIDSVYTINVKPISVQEDTQAYTKDNQPIDIKYNVIFTNPVNDIANTVIQYQGYPYEAFAQAKLTDAIKAIAGKYTASEFVTKREVIRKDFVTLAKTAVINDQSGRPVINVIDTPITNVDFDDQYETAIKDKQVMQQKAQQKEYEYQAAQRDAQITVTKAEADAKALQVKAQAIAKSPSIVRLEEIKKWDGHFPLNAKVIGSGATIVDSK